MMDFMELPENGVADEDFFLMRRDAGKVLALNALCGELAQSFV